jgi:hypothetical protein
VFAAPTAEDMKISLINNIGEISYSSEQALPAGNFSTVIDTGNLPAGTYVLKILLGRKVYARKIIIAR